VSVAFCVGTGRCGTTFLARVAGAEPEVAASHERLRLAATFHMFCKWNGLAVDPEGFLVDREAAIREDLARRRVSFEASALLSHSIAELSERFGARFLLLVRRPDQTVASFAVRGWFLEPPARRDPSLPPSYREGEEPRHFFGRNLPRGAAFERWAGLSQIGRLGWFWAARNGAVLEQLRALPADRRRIERLEDLDFARYREVAAFLGWEAALAREAYEAIAGERPNAGPNLPRGCGDWTAREVAEFEAEVGPLAAALGYEHRVERLLGGGAAVRPGRLDVDAVLARV
jgi:hypothetical protein